jgi:hypothetical protein
MNTLTGKDVTAVVNNKTTTLDPSTGNVTVVSTTSTGGDSHGSGHGPNNNNNNNIVDPSMIKSTSPFVTHSFVGATTDGSGNAYNNNINKSTIGKGSGGSDSNKNVVVGISMKSYYKKDEKSGDDINNDDDFDITFNYEEGYGNNGKKFDDLDVEIDAKAQQQQQQHRDYFWVWMCIMTLTFIGLVTYGFVSGLFLPNSNGLFGGSDDSSSSMNNNNNDEDRQQYYDHLLEYFDYPLLEPSSAQSQAMEWLAFEDTKFDISSSFPSTDGEMDNMPMPIVGSRLHQRYALVTWYFDQGGPKFWTKINNDKNAGWIQHGVGVHECDWTGIDCEEQELTVNNNDGVTTERVVLAVRLRPTYGIVLTGTSLTPEMGLLTNLRRLEAADQRLVGSIPNEWRTLTNLGELL